MSQLRSNAGDRDNLLAHPEYLILAPEGLAEPDLAHHHGISAAASR
jgi:hypothetical protein